VGIVRDEITITNVKDMEGMDLMIDMKNQKLVGVHGDEQIGILY
jgi:hypothetical protein